MRNEMEEMGELITELDSIAGHQVEMAEVMKELGWMVERQVEIADRLHQLKLLAETRLQRARDVVCKRRRHGRPGAGWARARWERRRDSTESI